VQKDRRTVKGRGEVGEPSTSSGMSRGNQIRLQDANVFGVVVDYTKGGKLSSERPRGAGRARGSIKGGTREGQEKKLGKKLGRLGSGNTPGRCEKPS